MGANLPEGDLASGRAALMAGDSLAAEAIFEQLASTNPTHTEVRYWLASALLLAGDPKAAQAMDDARILHAMRAAQHMGADVGRCRTAAATAASIAVEVYTKNLIAISAVIRGIVLKAVAIDDHGLLSYALAMQHQGRVEEACALLGPAAETFPSPQLDEFQIFPQIFCEDGQARQAAAARRWVVQ